VLTIDKTLGTSSICVLLGVCESKISRAAQRGSIYLIGLPQLSGGGDRRRRGAAGMRRSV
jgi:hypothetical protein